MSKINDALKILSELGLPRAQQNDRSALTLLALADLKEKDSWTKIKQRNIGIHFVMIFIKENYGKTYAENSRETIRRQTLHQFEQAGIAIRNADDPSRVTNSAKNVYCLSDDAIKVISSYNTKGWNAAKTIFSKKQGNLAVRYSARKMKFAIVAELPTGKLISLSPGKHNDLEQSIVTDFRQIFCPNTNVLYIGDTADKMSHIESKTLEGLKFPTNQHDKLPDVILYDKTKNVLFLVEAVTTTHGPVSAKRFEELEVILKDCTAKRIYISAFLDFTTYKKYSADIAWETEVWIKENPEHMIHLNGEKFFTIYE
jgi:hypothetical protein